MKLLVGLGNPDSSYKLTRHNIGFMVIEYLAAKHGIKLSKTKYGACWGQGTIDGNEVTLALPLKYMNLSGQPVRQLQQALEISESDLLVICDDFNLLLGMLRLRKQGSAGGHNGLKSIIDCLHTQEFARLRLGIGPPPVRQDTADFVLEPFKTKEWPQIEEMIECAAQTVETYLNEGITAAMNAFNK